MFAALNPFCGVNATERDVTFAPRFVLLRVNVFVTTVFVFSNPDPPNAISGSLIDIDARTMGKIIMRIPTKIPSFRYSCIVKEPRKLIYKDMGNV
jgi:hypothetical protein